MLGLRNYKNKRVKVDSDIPDWANRDDSVDLVVNTSVDEAGEAKKKSFSFSEYAVHIQHSTGAICL